MWRVSLIRCIGSVALLLALRAHAEASTGCPEGEHVALEIRIEPPDVAAHATVERHVRTEVRAGGVEVCTQAAGASGLAQIRLDAVSRDFSHVLIVIQRDDSALFERELQLARLPYEARPLAIASATDELLRAVLSQPRAAAAAEPVAAPPVGADAPATQPSGAFPRSRPWFALGLMGQASTFVGQREAAGADLQGRVWFSSRWFLQASGGASARLHRPEPRGVVQPEHDLQAALGVGYELLPNDTRFGLTAQAGFGVMRVRFDEQDSGTIFTAAGRVAQHERSLLDSAWALMGHLGGEARWRFHGVELAAALDALVPLVPATSDWAETTSLDHLGLELRLGVWVPFGAAAP